MKGSKLHSVNPAFHCLTCCDTSNLISEGKELPRFQHFRSTKTSNKFLNVWGKIISAKTLLDENMFVACKERLHLYSYDMILYHRNIKVHQSRYSLLLMA